MAVFASEPGLDALVIDRLGRFVIRDVAGNAVGAQADETSDGGPGVARLAVDRGMSSSQRKAVLVFFNRPPGYLPADL